MCLTLIVFAILEDELGSSAFGVVYFAHAFGIANFLTRRSTLKDNKSQRRFSFTRLKKRNFSLSTNYCDVVNTAVKTLKGNQNLVHLSWFSTSSVPYRNVSKTFLNFKISRLLIG
jgi:hypothetical protein